VCSLKQLSGSVTIIGPCYFNSYFNKEKIVSPFTPMQKLRTEMSPETQSVLSVRFQ